MTRRTRLTKALISVIHPGARRTVGDEKSSACSGDVSALDVWYPLVLGVLLLLGLVGAGAWLSTRLMTRLALSAATRLGLLGPCLDRRGLVVVPLPFCGARPLLVTC